MFGLVAEKGVRLAVARQWTKKRFISIHLWTFDVFLLKEPLLSVQVWMCACACECFTKGSVLYLHPSLALAKNGICLYIFFLVLGADVAHCSCNPNDGYRR